MSSRPGRNVHTGNSHNEYRSMLSRCFPVIAICSQCLYSPDVFAMQSVQPGFVLHVAGKSTISLSGIRSGELCQDIGESVDVCNTGTGLTVLPRDSCITNKNSPYPCTRYGYRYDYADATPGTQIECTATRRDPFNQEQKTYTIAIDAESGSVFQPEWIPYNPVESRVMLTEVHECVYLGKRLATIEYIISYEPSPELAPFAPGDPNDTTIDEPYSFGVPDACNYLTQHLAKMWVEDDVSLYLDATEHLPNLRSHCSWFVEDDLEKIAKIEHKYHLYELFDIRKLNRMQLSFHAAFAAGGHEPESMRTDLGKITFVFQLAEQDRSAISVVTGIQGPPDDVGRPRELLAHYHLRNPDRTHEERLGCLFDLARKSLALWFGEVVEADNTVTLPDLPEDLNATCAGSY